MFAIEQAKKALKLAGLRVRSVRKRPRGRSGFELTWGKADPHLEPVYISGVERDGKLLSFLVRDTGDYIQEMHLMGRLYSEEELSLIASHYRGDTFLDIGANVGNHTIFAAACLNAPRVIACEPNPRAARILMCNVALNDLGQIVEHVPSALSDHQGSAAMAEPSAFNLGRACIAAQGDIAITIIEGDKICEGENIGFIKIDVEGHEIQVLSGLTQTINRCSPVMLVEVGNENRTAFDSFCKSYRYRVVDETSPYEGQTNLLVLRD